MAFPREAAMDVGYLALGATHDRKRSNQRVFSEVLALAGVEASWPGRAVAVLTNFVQLCWLAFPLRLQSQ